jgi:ribosomal protein S18 acetylase RimI-like enzyme
MVVITPITLKNLPACKEVRLCALKESPGAFGATYARESQLTSQEWKDRIARWNGEIGIGFLAFDDGVACGIAGSFLHPDNPSRAQLVSMWTAPSQRQRGVGRMLVEEVAAWALARGATVLDLFVVANNLPAIHFYQRLGFVQTGRTQPYPNDPALVEHEMARSLPFAASFSPTRPVTRPLS